MKLSKIKISNFRCYGDKETVLTFNDLTSLIGCNSSGKTSLLQALLLMFGEKSSERIIKKSDFHIPYNKQPDDILENQFYIETVFTFPELINNTDGFAVPAFFKHFTINSDGDIPLLRIRLEATWTKTSNPEGSIDSNIYYITSSEEDEIQEENKKIALRQNLDNIKMIYVPAIRKPSEQLKNVSGTIISRILNSINWSDTVKNDLKEKINEVDSVFSSEVGVNLLKQSLDNQWKKYHTDSRYSNATIRFNSTDLESILKKIEVKFSPTETTREYNVDELGDGLRSTFYISLVNTLLDLELNILDQIKEKTNSELPFSLVPPVLTIVAIEEPENHVSPHMLGRIIENLYEISSKEISQTILTSHSPAIIKRIDPENIRHFRLSSNIKSTIINQIILPDRQHGDEIYKYVKEAICSYPELYFSNLVILGEGDSESIILNKLFEINNLNLDNKNISVVPLGGRYVNYFWKLLNNLNIPFITLLDLDRERYGGGWGRIKYAMEQLINIGSDKQDLLLTTNGVMSDHDFNKMHNWEVSQVETMNGWINMLENYNVFFSAPLDIDFAMLKHFKQNYLITLNQNEGPFIKGKGKIIDIENYTQKPLEYLERIEKDKSATLKAEGGDGSTYSVEEKELMVWYNYFFLNRGKPTTHIKMLLDIDKEDLRDKVPDFLNKILRKSKELLNIHEKDNKDV